MINTLRFFHAAVLATIGVGTLVFIGMLPGAIAIHEAVQTGSLLGYVLVLGLDSAWWLCFFGIVWALTSQNKNTTTSIP